MTFILYLLILISVDTFCGCLIYFLWKYLDMKYFSQFEITQLKQENEYLKQENKKINGASTDFWEN